MNAACIVLNWVFGFLISAVVGSNVLCDAVLSRSQPFSVCESNFYCILYCVVDEHLALENVQEQMQDTWRQF